MVRRWRYSETARAWETLADVALNHAERDGVSNPKHYLQQAANVMGIITLTKQALNVVLTQLGRLRREVRYERAFRQ